MPPAVLPLLSKQLETLAVVVTIGSGALNPKSSEWLRKDKVRFQGGGILLVCHAGDPAELAKHISHLAGATMYQQTYNPLGNVFLSTAAAAIPDRAREASRGTAGVA